ncbi:hypothetical protein ACHAPC_007627 [Botrytis cinerea]|uniref:Putative short-chain dehydrogenase reductase protein n=1 Tax=Botryotinia fuckeliana (strain BcDW1) TaxID=1290391 RepID=M7TQL7_BOTF1|nr:putative short-chain dehydrogenase reductase protein [Botrytis cinerea BcDW1]
MDFLRAQFTKIPKLKPVNLSKSTVLITGANAGLGLEAAHEILLSKPERLILAVRDIEKGDVAKRELQNRTTSSTQIDVHKLDHSSFRSVQNFVKELEGQRVDIAILNAGTWNTHFTTTTDGYEGNLQVNTLAPALLSLLLLPNLRAAASSPRPADAPQPHLSIVSSGLHEMAKFPEKDLPQGEILAALNDATRYTQSDRYPVTKAISLLWTKELSKRIPSSEIIINAPTPGFCKTGLMSQTSGIMGLIVKLAFLSVGRSAQDGSRCLVDAAVSGPLETHGRYLSEMKIKLESELVRSEQGEELGKKLWKEIMDVFARGGLAVQGSLPDNA